MRTVEFKIGDWAYRKQTATTTKPPWEPQPFKIIKIKGLQLTGDRDGQISKRYISDWKKITEEETDQGKEEDAWGGRSDHPTKERNQRTDNDKIQEEEAIQIRGYGRTGN